VVLSLLAVQSLAPASLSPASGRSWRASVAPLPAAASRAWRQAHCDAAVRARRNIHVGAVAPARRRGRAHARPADGPVHAQRAALCLAV